MKVCSVVICDDETWICQSLQKMLADSGLPVSVSGCFSNGREALEHIRKSPPDVLVTDIRMPELDGLELVSQCRVAAPEMQVVIISGYDDFHYARTALRNGVSDYLLKPIDKKMFQQTLSRLVMDSGKKRRALSVNRRTGELMQHMTKQIVSGELESLADFLSLLELDGIDTRYLVGELLYEGERLPYTQVERELQQGLDTASSRIGKAVVFEKRSGCASFLVVSRGGRAGQADLRFVIDNLPASLRVCSAASSGGWFPRPEQIQDSSAESERIMRTRCVEETGLVVDNTARQAGWRFDRASRYSELLTAMQLRDEAMLDAALAGITEAFWVQPNAPHRHLVSFCVSACLGILELLYRAPEKPEALVAAGETFRLRAGYYFSGRRCFAVFEDFCRQAFAYFRRLDGQDASGKLVERIIGYLQGHYAEPVTLAYIAEIFHVNASYLSSLFKQRAGINFLEYLTALRLEAAAKYLVNTDKSIAELAVECGYDNERYFGRQFKKRYGITPSGYRIRERKL